MKKIAKKVVRRRVTCNGIDAIDAIRTLSGSGSPDEFLHDATRVEVTVAGARINPRHLKIVFLFEEDE